MNTSNDKRSRDEPTEDSWVYMSGPVEFSGAHPAAGLYELLTDACAAKGWHVYRPAEAGEAGNEDAPLASRLRHALAHADACVFYVGSPSLGVGTELAWAAEHGRPVLAVRMRDERPSALVESLLREYGRARVLLCDTPEDCAERVRKALSDPEWENVVRAAGAELAEDLLVK